ncbi:hypothetical protein SEUCBS139899_004175 [Sporothrix eucalyptigena]
MASQSRSHHPGSQLYGGRTVSSSTSGSLLRKLTSLTRRSKSQPMLTTSRYTPSASHSTPATSRTSTSYPDRMALAAAQTASLKAIATTSITTNANTARPISGTHLVPEAIHLSVPAPLTAPLVVQVEIRFPSLDSQSDTPIYTHEYTSSADLAVTNRLCKGLLRRLHHCSTELITRKDSRALKQHRRQGQQTTTKPLSYEIHFRVFRQDTGVWADRTYSSYQRQGMTDHDAHEIILTTHRMVGLFLRRHDPSFHWTDLPPTQTAAFPPCPEAPELVRHTVGHPLPLSCVPQSRFLEGSQSFEFCPGYAINLTFSSRCHGRKQYEWKRVINLQSKQNAPLNLALAENLLWDTFNSVNNSLSGRRDAFLEEHKACDFLEGVVGCQHFGEDALDIELGIENKLGPNFNHLKRSIQSKLGLFRDPDGRDCQDFFLDIHRSLVRARDSADGQITALPDFDLRILNLSAPTWSVENPARFVLDTPTSYSRRSVEAMLDRVQTGVSDVLRNRDCTIHLVAYKRGHLVLDKALIARPLPPKPALFPMPTAVEQAGPIVARLTERIHRDLNAVCKDTCSLDGISENSDDDLGRADESQDSILESPTAASPVHGAFEQTIILEDPAAVEDEEPTIPAPRVVELPDDVFVDALEHSTPSPSPTPSSRRRAFPLIPEKFTLPHSRSTSSVKSVAAQPIQEEEEVTGPVAPVEALVEAPVEVPIDVVVEPVEAVVEAPVETPTETLIQPGEALIDSIDNVFIEAPIAIPAEFSEPALSVHEEDVVTAPEENDVDPLVENTYDAEVLSVAEENSSSETEDAVKDEPAPTPEAEPTPVAEVNEPSDEADGIAEKSVDEEIEDSVYNDFDSANTSVPEVEGQRQQPVLDSPPIFYTFDDGDFEEQPSVELRFGRPGSPTIGTPLETILEYDSEPDTEFAFDLPAYEEFVPPQRDFFVSEQEPMSSKSAGKQPALFFADEPYTESAAESSYESAPDTVFKSPSVTESDMNELFVPSSPPSQDDHEESYIANTTILTNVSSNFTRPSTPSLSISSGEVNSPEMSLLDTPNVGLGHSGMVACFGSDGSGDFDFGRACGGYEADSEPDNSDSGNFAQYLGNEKPSNHSLAGQSLFGQSLAVPFPSHHCDLSESESAPTEIWRGATTDDITVSAENMGQLLNFDSESDYAAGPFLARSITFKDSFEDFAMTKPTLDLDEYAEIVAEDEDIHADSVNTTIEEALPEVVDNEFSYKQQLANTEPVEEDLIQDAEVKEVAAVEQIVLCDFDGLQDKPVNIEVTIEVETKVELAVEETIVELRAEFEPEPEAQLEVSPEPVVLVEETIVEPKTVVEPETVVEVEHTIVAEVDAGVANETVDECPQVSAESVPLPDFNNEDLEEVVVEEVEEVVVEEAELPALANEAEPESGDNAAFALASDALQEDAEAVIEVATQAEVVAEAEPILEDNAVEENIIEEHESVSVQHVEFATPLANEVEAEARMLSDSSDALDVQEELPTDHVPAQEESSEPESVIQSTSLDAVNEPISELAKESGQSPQPWLELTVPETETPIQVASDLDAEQEPSSPISSGPEGDDNTVSPVTSEDSVPVLGESELSPLEGTQEPVQTPEVEDAKVVEFIVVSTTEDTLTPLEIPVRDIELSNPATPTASPDTETPEPVATAELSVEIAKEEDAAPVLPEANRLDDADVLPESIERAVCETTTIPESLVQVPVLHASTKDGTVELGNMPALVSVVQSILNAEPAPVFHTEMKSLSLDSALRHAPLELAVETSPAPKKCDTPLVEDSTRDSIDSINDFVEDAAPPAAKRLTSWSLPRSGLLGLDETRLVKVGLRGALTGSSAFDNVPFSKKRQHRAAMATEAAPGACEAAAQSKVVTATSSTTDSPVTAQEGMLPRVVIAFASMAIMSQMINRSS